MLLLRFHFNRIWGAVAEVAYQPDTADIHYFSFDFLANVTSEYRELDDRYQVVELKEYELGTSLWVQVAVVMSFNFLAWWCGQVFSAGDGSSQPACFCLLPRYWLPSIEALKRAREVDQDDRIGVEKKKSAEDQSVRCHMLSKAFAEETWSSTHISKGLKVKLRSNWILSSPKESLRKNVRRSKRKMLRESRRR